MCASDTKRARANHTRSQVVAAINDAPGCVAAAVASRDLGRAQKWATEHEASKGAMKAYGKANTTCVIMTLLHQHAQHPALIL